MADVAETAIETGSAPQYGAFNVLMITDPPVDKPILQELITRSCLKIVTFEETNRITEEPEGTAVRNYDIILLDISRPENCGLGIFYRIREQIPDLPVIIISDSDDENLAIKALQAGAQDFLVKGHLESNMITRALRSAIERHRYLEKLEQARKIERYLAYHDTLTTLPNRQLFFDRLVQSLAHARRNEKCMSVLFLDLDRFKWVNDSLGHSAGDLLLKSIAERLTGCIRDSETAARFGGDEFVVILSEMAHERDAAIVAQRILDALKNPFVLAGQECFISSSIGISIYPSDGRTPESLVKNADTAMYQAKKMGGHRYIFYSQPMNIGNSQQTVHEEKIQNALERKELILHYQPQLSLKTGRIVSVEALVRWHHPDLGIIPPAQFIPSAEKTGLIVQIGEYVLRLACEQIKEWLNTGCAPVRVAVNLSLRQLRERYLIKHINQVLELSNIDPGLLGLEITESGTIFKGDHTIDMLHSLKKRGISLSIDDFGTGYSSLSHLKYLPIEILKIDRSFISNITSDPEDVAITRAIITMAHSLGLKVIAEGVEAEEQLNLLRTLDCDMAQGNYLSQPVPADKLMQLLTESNNSARVTN